MATITTRAGKGSPLTNDEVDANFTNLNSDKIENVVEDTTPQLGGNLDTNGNDITFGDNDKAIFGAGSDLQVYHDSGTSHSYIAESGSGHLFVQGTNIMLEAADGSNYIYGVDNEAVYIYHPDATNGIKLRTQSTGIDVTGTVTADGVTLGDNQKAIFGTGSDLQIYHDGDNSYIDDQGTGELRLRGTNFRIQNASGTNTYIAAFDGSSTNLYHAGVTKLSTTSTGIDVTGTVVADGLTVDGNASVTGSITENSSPVVVQSDIGTDPDEIPLNQYLGSMAYQDADAVNIGGGVATLRDNGTHVLTLDRLDSDGEIARFSKDGSTVGSIGTVNGFLGIGTNDTGLVFIDVDNTIRPFNPSSNTDVDDSITLGTVSRRFKDLYLSGGVYVGGTTSANLLDDYEEGTFTPTLSGGGSGVTYSTQIGAYRKVGTLVTYQLQLNVNAVTPTSGAIKIGGLPFASASSATNGYGGAYITYQINFDTNATDTFHHADTSTELSVITSSGTARLGNASGITLGGEIMLCGQYITS